VVTRSLRSRPLGDGSFFCLRENLCGFQKTKTFLHMKSFYMVKGG